MMEEERKWCVYVHENKINGKRYVGITSQKPERRWGKAGRGYRGQYFGNVIEKYGFDCFNHTIIYTDLIQEEAETIEYTLIREYNSDNREYGYNIDSGGGVKSLGEHPSAKTVICDGTKFSCLRECAKYYNVKYNTMASWLNSNTKMPNKWIELGLSYNGCETIYHKQTGKAKGINHGSSKCLYCDGKIYDTVKECAKLLDVNYNTLLSWISGHRPMQQKYIDLGLRYATQEESDQHIESNQINKAS